MISGYAIYRLPYAEECCIEMQREGELETLLSLSALSEKSGFVVAPFKTDRKHPVVLMKPDFTMMVKPSRLLDNDDSEMAWLVETLENSAYDRPEGEQVRNTGRGHYEIDFANFHSHILEGEFTKIVLARCAVEERKEKPGLLPLFVKACAMYPRMMVTLVSTKTTGTWLMATPEMLLEGDGEKWKTISLAGTMNLSGHQLDFDNPPLPQGHADDSEIGWNVKNIQEQRFVSTFITECLEQYATDIMERGPYTMRAGNLVHLRSDFEFVLTNPNCIGDLLNTLYPTPAVCGLPKQSSLDFIMGNEYAPRLYYSGFVGPLRPEGATHLYVSLRCMRIDSDGCSLYAGGGLLADSKMETEWMETEYKLGTMRALFNNE